MSRPDDAPEFSRLLAEKSGVFHLRIKTYLGLFWAPRTTRGPLADGRLPCGVGFDPGQEADIRGLFELCSLLSDPMRQRMEFYARHGLDIQSEAEELVRCTRRVHQVLTSWQPATVTKSKALRIRYVNREEASALGLPTG